jgi:hypothetical protein
MTGQYLEAPLPMALQHQNSVTTRQISLHKHVSPLMQGSPRIKDCRRIMAERLFAFATPKLRRKRRVPPRLDRRISILKAQFVRQRQQLRHRLEIGFTRFPVIGANPSSALSPIACGLDEHPQRDIHTKCHAYSVGQALALLTAPIPCGAEEHPRRDIHSRCHAHPVCSPCVPEHPRLSSRRPIDWSRYVFLPSSSLTCHVATLRTMK